VRWLLVLLASCGFDADYSGGRFTCSDGKCPAGQTCVANECVVPHDAGADDADAAIDARPAMLLCTDPGILPAGGGTAMGTTNMRNNTVDSLCNSLVMNGPDAVYRVNAALGAHIGITVSGSYPVRGYVIAPCVVSPNTQGCVGNMFATQTAPISVTTTFAGEHYIIVDGENAGLSGTYTLTVTVN
jgi:hypothetical protein